VLLEVQGSIRVGGLVFERFRDKLRIARDLGQHERELAILEPNDLLKLKLWLNGDL